MDPLLIDIPERIETERLVLRPPRAGDGAKLNAAVLASLDELAPWMPWAARAPSVEESETIARRAHAQFEARSDLVYSMFRKEPDGREGEIVGGTGLHRHEWTVRRFEIGYWRRTGHAGQGFASEAVQAMTRLAFDVLGARRVEVRMDDENAASWRLAERCGYTLEGLLRLDSLTPAGLPRSTRVYARVRGIEEA